MKQPRDNLPDGTVIDSYRIVKTIGRGGFSLIYLADDTDTQERVVIKEYLPKKAAVRAESNQVLLTSPEQQASFEHGRKLFFEEAKALATLRHPNVVHLRNFFLANQTAYLVMDYEAGKNLGAYIRQRNGGLSTTFLMTVFPPILDALTQIHGHSQLHLDIKPANIHLRPGGSPLLLDFGAIHSCHRSRGKEHRQVVTSGFSPVEQYFISGKIGPWSDVYAIGATMRACIEGKPPPSAIERHAKDAMIAAQTAFNGRYPGWLLTAIDWAMAIEPADRPQDAGVLLKALNERQEVTGTDQSPSASVRKASNLSSS